MIWSGVAWCGLVWYDSVWCGMVWYDLEWFMLYDRVRCGMTGCNVVCVKLYVEGGRVTFAHEHPPPPKRAFGKEWRSCVLCRPEEFKKKTTERQLNAFEAGQCPDTFNSVPPIGYALVSTMSGDRGINT